jgi:uncharacterized Zn-finger protein
MKIIKTFLLICPKCGNKMKYQTDNPLGKKKMCVYCGKSFTAHTPEKTQILKRV